VRGMNKLSHAKRVLILNMTLAPSRRSDLASISCEIQTETLPGIQDICIKTGPLI
jgi:hypothetical protein